MVKWVLNLIDRDVDPAHWSRISCVAFVEEIWVQFWT